MVQDWIECTLADTCSSIDYGYTASAVDSAVGPKFLRITDIVSGHIDWGAVPYVSADEKTLEKYQLHNGDIVIARTGASTGASSYVHQPPVAVFASYLVRLKIKPEFDSRYLAYYLKSDAFWSYIRGVLGDKSAQPNASASTMTRAPIKLPRDKAEQREIAHILGTLDDKIQLNRRMNTTLEAIARAIFKSWFVDFDPVHTKMRGEQPYGMDAETAALFPDSFEDSELGPIPAGWGVKTVGEIAELRKSNIRPQDFPTEFFDYYSLPAFDNGQMPAKELGENIRSNKFLIPDGCVLLSKLNPVFPKIWLSYDTTEHRSISSTEFLVMLPKSNSTREFLYSLFSSERFLAEFSNLVTGTSSSHQRVKPADFLSMKITFPKWPAIQQFTGFVVALLEKIQANQLQSLLLAELRNALLPKLISGDMQIGEYNDATSS